MTAHTFWYLARSSGLVATALLTATVLAGVLLAGRMSGRRPGAPWVLDVHRGMAALAVSAVGVHMAALVADSYLHFGVVELVVPLASDWRPVPVAAGVLAAWTLAAVQATSLARRTSILGWTMSSRTWRRVHWLSYLAWVLAIGHTATAGTDALRPAIASIGAGATAGVLVYVVVRWRTRRRRTSAGRSASARTSPRPAPSRTSR